MKMLHYLKEKVADAYESGSDFYELPYELFGPDNVTNWPNDVEDEPQDMENFEWQSIDSEEVVVFCGGDWQEGMKIILGFVNNKLSVINHEISQYEEGTYLSEDEFNELLFGTSNVDEYFKQV